MRKLSLLLALGWLVCAPFLCVAAEQTLPGVLGRLGMTDAQAGAFTAQLAAQDAPFDEASLAAALAELVSASEEDVVFERIGSVYADSRGFSAMVPEGWTLHAPGVGGTVIFQGNADANGFAPAITVLLMPASDSSLFHLTREEIDEAFGQALANYRTLEWESLTFQEIPAQELVCVYGADDQLPLMQYQISFVQDDTAFLITMTTLAEETIHDETVAAYDTFLEEFIVFTGFAGQGNG